MHTFTESHVLVNFDMRGLTGEYNVSNSNLLT